MPGKYLDNENGILTQKDAVDESAGAADAGEIVKLNADGKIDETMMPTGIGADTSTIEASENLADGDFVNIFDSSGAKVRKADATGANAGKMAHGFVKAAVTSGQDATVYFEGTNDHVTGLTPGNVYLGTTAGQATGTAPSGTGQTVQRLGVATSATSINVEFGPPIVLA